jgi:hypothetical protein
MFWSCLLDLREYLIAPTGSFSEGSVEEVQLTLEHLDKAWTETLVVIDIARAIHVVRTSAYSDRWPLTVLCGRKARLGGAYDGKTDQRAMVGHLLYLQDCRADWYDF